jgi:hypothetical protein
MRIHLIFLLFPILLIQCTSESEKPASAETPVVPVESLESLEYTVNIDYLRMRATPGQDGEVVATLNRGDVLQDLGEVSGFTSQVKLRGIQFDEPWIRVRTSEGKEGWVFAGGLHFSMDGRQAIAERLMSRRLTTFFGDALQARILDYQKAYWSASTDREVQKVFAEGLALRDTLVGVLEKGIVITSYDQLPDLFWMEEALPGMLTQLVAEGTIYYLFMDFREWLTLAAQSQGKADDAFFALQVVVHPTDSIEYFFPAWMIQTWDYGGHSELGKGVHLEVLNGIQANTGEDVLFSEQLTGLKKQVFENLTNTEQGYWYDQEKVLAEFDKILEKGDVFFTDTEVQRLQEVRTKLADPEKYDILLNARGGTQ